MLTYSQEADAAYVYVAPSTGDGEVGYTVVCECTGVELNLDYSPGGRLLGIEILGARQTLAPHVLEGTRPGKRGDMRYSGDDFPGLTRVRAEDRCVVELGFDWPYRGGEAVERRPCPDDRSGEVAAVFVGAWLAFLIVEEASQHVPEEALARARRRGR